MLECLNEKCESNKDNKCTDKLVNMPSSLTGCPIRINYAEENINYEEEYYKLKKEKENLENAIEITKNKGIEWMNKYNDIKAENKKILIENAALQELKASYEDSMDTMNDLAIERKKDIEKQKITVEALLKGNKHLEMEMNNRIKERDNYKEIAENQSKKIEELERENSGLKDKLETIDDEYQEEIKILKDKAEENKENLEEYEMLKKIIKKFASTL